MKPTKARKVTDKLKFKVKGQEIHGPGNFFYRTEEDPIMLAALFELAYATGDNAGYAEAVSDFQKHAAMRQEGKL